MFNLRKNDTEINRILFDLKTISKYKCGEIVDTTDSSLRIEENSYKKSINRTLTGDSSRKALDRIKRCVGIAFDYAELLYESKYMMLYSKNNDITSEELECYNARFHLLKNICSHIRVVIPGIEAFKTTLELKNYSTMVSECIIFMKDINQRQNALIAFINSLESTYASYISNKFESSSSNAD